MLFIHDNQSQELSKRNCLYFIASNTIFDLTNATRESDGIIKELLTHKPKKLILDMKVIDIIDSSALGALIYISSACKKIECKMYIVNLNEDKKHTFEIMGVDDFIILSDSIDDIISNI